MSGAMGVGRHPARSAWPFWLVLVGALLATWPCWAADEPARGDRRVALVIGNGDYRHADKLANPVTDARNIRKALTGLNFDVVYGENLDKRTIERTIGRFATAAQAADVALVYFAGHGATFGDVPYVVPVDAEFASLDDMPYELVPVETLLGELRRARGLRIAILDACRDNGAERALKKQDLRGGETTRGLARVKNPEGLILAYATQYLSTAGDGTPDGDSPFTQALLDNIARPGLDVKEMFYKVGHDVIAQTGGRQRPEISISFFDSYSLAGSAPAPASPAPAAAAGADEIAWKLVKSSRDPKMIRDFLAEFPDSRLRGAAEAVLARITVATLEPPASRPQAPATTMSGTWTGAYAYPDGRQSVGFTFTFDPTCHGRSEELNTIGDRSAPKLYADLTCNVGALTAGQAIMIAKHYDGTGKVSHGVLYQGTVSADLNQITGEWVIGAMKGKFTMRR